MKHTRKSVFVLLFLLTLAGQASAVRVPNGGFEVPGEGALPEGWQEFPWTEDAQQAVCSRDETVAHSGTASLKAFQTGESPSARCWTRTSLRPGLHILSFWARTEEGKEAKARVFFGYREWWRLPVGDEWQQYHFSLPLKFPIAEAEILLANATGAASTVWFDDVEITRAPFEQPRASVQRGEEGARFAVAISSLRRLNEPLSLQLEALLPGADGKPRVAPFSFDNRRGRAEVNLDYLKPGMYDFRYSILCSEDRKVLFTSEVTKRDISSLPSLEPQRVSTSLAGAVALDLDGTCLVSGEPFFPVGIYCYEPTAFEEVKELGFNTVVTHGNMENLERCEELGLKVIGQIWPDSTSEGVAASTEEVVNGIKDSPALLAYYLWDEPDLNKTSEEVVRLATAAAARADPYHPTFTTFYIPETFHRFARTVDIFAPDPYPIAFHNTRPMMMVSDWVDRAWAAARRGQSVFPVLQTFQAAPYWLLPTPEQLRCMAYLAVIHGAKAIIYYEYGGAKDTPLWDAFRPLNEEMKALSPVLLVGSASERFHVFPRQVGVDVLEKEHEGHLYIIAANTQDHPTEVQFKSRREQGTVEVMFEGRSLPLTDGAFLDSFPPYGVHVYRLPLEEER